MSADPTLLAAQVLAELDPEVDSLDSLVRESPAGDPQSVTRPTRGTPANLSASFYDERPALAHIRDAAYSRARSADAVLGCVLARLAVLTPPTVRLPAPVDSEGTLDLCVAIIGRSGAGKSGAAKVARYLLPIDADDLDRRSADMRHEHVLQQQALHAPLRFQRIGAHLLHGAERHRHITGLSIRMRHLWHQGSRQHSRRNSGRPQGLHVSLQCQISLDVSAGGSTRGRFTRPYAQVIAR